MEKISTAAFYINIEVGTKIDYEQSWVDDRDLFHMV